MKILKTLRKRGLALFLVLTMCMTMLPATALADGETSNPAEQFATVSKDIVKRTGPDTWELEMTVTAKEVIRSEPLNLVLVLDTSGSMTWCAGDPHRHTAECGGLKCGKTEHTHTANCPRKLTCGWWHDHNERCYSYTCGFEKHTHGKNCFDETKVTCGQVWHPHNDKGDCTVANNDYTKSRQYIAGEAAKNLLSNLKDQNVTVSIVTFSYGAIR